MRYASRTVLAAQQIITLLNLPLPAVKVSLFFPAVR
jgi:hypothetical protein